MDTRTVGTDTLYFYGTAEVQKYGFCLDSSDSLSAKALNTLNLDLSEANTDSKHCIPIFPNDSVQ